MIKRYEFNYGMNDSQAVFTVDDSKFTKEMAQSFLDFFHWETGYDEFLDPIEEAMTKIAMRTIIIGCEGQYNLQGIISQFGDLEGYPRIDGSIGITLIEFYPYEFTESDLSVKII